MPAADITIGNDADALLAPSYRRTQAGATPCALLAQQASPWHPNSVM